MKLRDVNPGVRVYVPLWNDGVLYDVQVSARHVEEIVVVSEEDQKALPLPSDTEVIICEEDDVVHEYDARCPCANCQERRLGIALEE